MGPDPVVVRVAQSADLSYLVALQRRHYEMIGFLPEMAVAGYLGVGPYASRNPNHRGYVAEVNDERVGFLLTTPGRRGASVKVTQVCLQEDARRNEYGTALVREAELQAIATQRGAVSCAVAMDLDARGFWDALGYEVRHITDGGKRRGRLLERRYKVLPCGLALPIPEAQEVRARTD